ncbi:MAG TPA: peptidoglycan DD-metalloendopeptidase family protein [Gammaproteobacteria bacterium]
MRYAVVLLLLALGSCTSTLVDYEARVHVVQPGDTLYTIAWRHGVDHRQLATWNNLSNPDLIFVGQRIRLTPLPTASGSASARRSPASAPRPTPSARATAPEPPVLPPPQWQWPMRGPIVSAYGDNRAIASGIGIGGSVGQAVEAAAAGRVVYTGSGLIGYGQLVIVKHNDTYLSAYGHLSRVLVAQGQDVRRGEKIAEMGTGPQRQPRLHFEIRRNGVPVDPTLLLGSRG